MRSVSPYFSWLVLPFLVSTAFAGPPAPQPASKPAASAQPPAEKPTDHPPTCEVEMFGEFKLPKLQPGEHAYAFVAQDSDCLAKNAHILGSNQLTDDGHMFIEVFSRWGADLTLCVAVAKGPDKPTTYYGKSPAKYHAEAVGEVMIPKITFPLKPGPRLTFPASKPPLPDK